MFTLQATLVLCFILSSAYGAPNSLESEIMEWEAPEFLRNNFTYYLSGHDHDGSPVFVLEWGKWNFRSAVEKGPETEAALDKWITQMILQWRSAGTAAVGSPGAVVISDCEGFDMVQFASIGVIQLLLKQFPKLGQMAQIPGIKRIYLVNANYLYERLYELGKPMLGDVVNIIELYGTNSAKWKPILLKEIPAEELPAWYGGSKSHQAIKIFG